MLYQRYDFKRKSCYFLLLFFISMISLVEICNAAGMHPNIKTQKGSFVVYQNVPSCVVTSDGIYLYGKAINEPISGNTVVYEIGTGYGSTSEGQLYGTTFEISAGYTMAYIPIGNRLYNGKSINSGFSIETYDLTSNSISNVSVSSGLLVPDTGFVGESNKLLITSDGVYVYNLAYSINDGGFNGFTVKIFDPSNSMALVRAFTSGTLSFEVRGLLADGDYLYAVEWTGDNNARIVQIDIGPGPTTGKQVALWKINQGDTGVCTGQYDATNDVVWMGAVGGSTVYKYQGQDEFEEFTYTATLNEESYVSGTGITVEGGYILEVEAEDADGNASDETARFVIGDGDIKGRIAFYSREFYGDKLLATSKLWDTSSQPKHLPIPDGTKISVIKNGSEVLAEGTVDDSQGNFAFEQISGINPGTENLTVKVYPQFLKVIGVTEEIVATVYTAEPGNLDNEIIVTPEQYAVIQDNESGYMVFDAGEDDPSIGFQAKNGIDDDTGVIEKDTIILPNTSGANGSLHVLSVISQGYNHVSSLFPDKDFTGLDVYLVDSSTRYDSTNGVLYLSSSESAGQFNGTWNDGAILKVYAQFVIDRIGVSAGNLAALFEEATSGLDGSALPQFATRDHTSIAFRNALGNLLVQAVLNSATDDLDSLNAVDSQFDFYPLDIVKLSSPSVENPLAVVLDDNGSRLVLEEGDTITTYPSHGITVESVGNDSVVMKVDGTDYTLQLAALRASSSGSVDSKWDTLVDLRKLSASEERNASDSPATTPDIRRSNFLATDTKHYSLFGDDNEAGVAAALWKLCGAYSNSDSRIWTVVEEYQPDTVAAFKEAWDTKYSGDGQYVDFAPYMADDGLVAECELVSTVAGVTLETDTLYPQYQWKPSTYTTLNLSDTGVLPSTDTAFSYTGMKSVLAGAMSQEAYETYEVKITDASDNEEYASLDSEWINPGSPSDYSDSYVQVSGWDGAVHGLAEGASFNWQVVSKRGYYGNDSVALSAPGSFQVALVGVTVETSGTGGSPVGGPTRNPLGDCSLAVPSGAFSQATVVVIDSFSLDSILTASLEEQGYEVFSPVYEVSFAGSLSQAATLTITPDQALTGDEYDTGIFQVEAISNGTVTVSFVESDLNSGDFSASISSAGRYVVLRNARQPFISDLAVGTHPFSPDNDSVRDDSEISFALSKPAYVSVKVFDGGSSLVKTLFDDALKMQGANSVTWDGKNDSSQTVSNGTYTIKLNAYDNCGQVASEIITSVDVFVGDTGTISGNGFFSGESDHTGIAVSVVDTTFTATTGSSGSFSITNVPPGTYDVTFSYDDYSPVTVTNQSVTANNTTTLSDQTLYLDSDIIAGLSLNIDDISPNADGYRDKVRADFELEQTADLTIYVYDSGDFLVKTLADWTSQAPGLYSVTWDGYDEGSSLVDDGAYDIQFSGTFDGSQSIMTKEAQVSVQRDVYVLDFTPADATVSPNDDQVNDTVDIRFSLVYDSTVSVTMYDGAEVVQELLASTAKNAKDGNGDLIVHSCTWDGTDGIDPVDNGEYIYTIVLSMGAVSGITRSGTITVTDMDTVTPSVTSISASPASFTPNNAGNIGITDESYVDITIADNNSNRLKVDLGVYDSLDALSYTFLDQTWKNTGNYSFVWFGKDDLGDYVDDGAYEFRARVEDEAGNVSGWFTDEVTVDNTNPTVTNISFTPNPFFPSDNYSEPGYDTTTIQYDVNDNLFGNVTVTIVIKDEGEVIKRNLITSMSHQQGTHQTSWDGEDDASQVVTDGTYSCTITVEDTAGNSASASLGNLVVDNSVPATVTGLTATEGDQLVDLDWDDWSDGGGPAFSEYRIYQSESSFTTVSGLTPIHTINTITSSSHEVSGLTNEVTYHFAVTVKNANGNENKTMTSEAAAPYDDNAAPAKVAGLATVPGDMVVDLSWTENTEEDLSQYNVYTGLAKAWETNSDFNGGTLDKVTVADDQAFLSLTDPASWDVLSDDFTTLSNWIIASGMTAEVTSGTYMHLTSTSVNPEDAYPNSLSGTMTGEVTAVVKARINDYPDGENVFKLLDLRMGDSDYAVTFKVMPGQVAVEGDSTDFEYALEMDSSFHNWRFAVNSGHTFVDVFLDSRYLFTAPTRSCSSSESVYVIADSDGSDTIDCEIDYIKVASGFHTGFESPGTLNLTFNGGSSRDWANVIFTEQKAQLNYSGLGGTSMTGEAETGYEHSQACDENYATDWSSGAVGSWPLDIVTDFGVDKSIKSLKYVSVTGTDPFAGKNYSIHTSSDGSSWSSSIASGLLSNLTGNSYEVVEFEAVSTRYMKLSFSDCYDSGNYVKAAEIQWLGDNADTDVKVRCRTGDTTGELESASYSGYCSTSEGVIGNADSQYIEFEVQFSTTDTLYTPVLDEIFVSYDRCSYDDSNTAYQASFHKQNLDNDTGYSFNVSAEDISSNEGEKSDTVKATPAATP